MNLKREAKRIARSQDRMARAAHPIIRRQMLRAINVAAKSYEHSGRLEMPDNFYRHMMDAIGDLQSQVAVKGIAETQRQIDSQESKFDWSALALRFFEEYAEAYIADKVTRITETTRKRIARIIDQGSREAATTAEISKRIRASAKVFTAYDAARVARTEVHGMYNYAATQTANLYADESIFVNRWIAVEDDRTRESHRDAHNQVREMGQPFDVNGESLAYPGDPSGSAGNIINCRCVAIRVRRDRL